ncbi:unnamed protein product [Protopolystoma xenopodis]|uniref:Uncharacterized protein n=1 Tax=Protopolystoma xenopodis TaxID=117903 RepID=A0A448WXT1_9PLAT|nr:unnamed protein product [Protopolystoma xenopodis]
MRCTSSRRWLTRHHSPLCLLCDSLQPEPCPFACGSGDRRSSPSDKPNNQATFTLAGQRKQQCSPQTFHVSTIQLHVQTNCWQASSNCPIRLFSSLRHAYEASSQLTGNLCSSTSTLITYCSHFPVLFASALFDAACFPSIRSHN